MCTLVYSACHHAFAHEGPKKILQAPTWGKRAEQEEAQGGAPRRRGGVPWARAVGAGRQLPVPLRATPGWGELKGPAAVP